MGSGCYNTQAYLDSLAYARNLIDFSENIGMRMTLLDIGGVSANLTQE